jgi:hypothetical protein
VFKYQFATKAFILMDKNVFFELGRKVKTPNSL